MISKPEFTDGELSFINIVLNKADPLGVMIDAISIKDKINTYGKSQIENDKSQEEKNKKDAEKGVKHKKNIKKKTELKR